MSERLAVTAIGAALAIFIAYESIIHIAAAFARASAAFGGR